MGKLVKLTAVEQSHAKSEYPVRNVEVKYDVETIGNRYQRIYMGLPAADFFDLKVLAGL